MHEQDITVRLERLEHRLRHRNLLAASMFALGASLALIGTSVATPDVGSAATEDGDVRDYERHWTPLHLDWVVDDIEAAVARAVAAGATLEQSVRERRWGRIAVLADPFGHGFCLIQFSSEGYDVLVE